MNSITNTSLKNKLEHRTQIGLNHKLSGSIGTAFNKNGPVIVSARIEYQVRVSLIKELGFFHTHLRYALRGQIFKK
jgi:hypothetical protein